MTCSRNAVQSIMIRLVDKRVKYFYENKETMVLGRLLFVQKRWFLRGMKNIMCTFDTTKELKRALMWEDEVDGDWFDRDGISLLFYAIAMDVKGIIRLLLDSAAGNKERLLSAVPKSGFPQVGITSKMNSLCLAMFMGSSDTVEMLLQSGIDPNDCSDGKGIDPFTFACVTGKLENMKSSSLPLDGVGGT